MKVDNKSLGQMKVSSDLPKADQFKSTIQAIDLTQEDCDKVKHIQDSKGNGYGDIELQDIYEKTFSSKSSEQQIMLISVLDNVVNKLLDTRCEIAALAILKVVIRSKTIEKSSIESSRALIQRILRSDLIKSDLVIIELKLLLQDILLEDESASYYRDNAYFHRPEEDCYFDSPECENIYFIDNKINHLANADNNSEGESYREITSRKSSISESHIDDSTTKGLEFQAIIKILENNQNNITEEKLAKLVETVDVANPDKLIELLQILVEKFTIPACVNIFCQLLEHNWLIIPDQHKLPVLQFLCKQRHVHILCDRLFDKLLNKYSIFSLQGKANDIKYILEFKVNFYSSNEFDDALNYVLGISKNKFNPHTTLLHLLRELNRSIDERANDIGYKMVLISLMLNQFDKQTLLEIAKEIDSSAALLLSLLFHDEAHVNINFIEQPTATLKALIAFIYNENHPNLTSDKENKINESVDIEKLTAELDKADNDIITIVHDENVGLFTLFCTNPIYGGRRAKTAAILKDNISDAQIRELIGLIKKKCEMKLSTLHDFFDFNFFKYSQQDLEDLVKLGISDTMVEVRKFIVQHTSNLNLLKYFASQWKFQEAEINGSNLDKNRENILQDTAFGNTFYEGHAGIFASIRVGNHQVNFEEQGIEIAAGEVGTYSVIYNSAGIPLMLLVWKVRGESAEVKREFSKWITSVDHVMYAHYIECLCAYPLEIKADKYILTKNEVYFEMSEDHAPVFLKKALASYESNIYSYKNHKLFEFILELSPSGVTDSSIQNLNKQYATNIIEAYIKCGGETRTKIIFADEMKTKDDLNTHLTAFYEGKKEELDVLWHKLNLHEKIMLAFICGQISGAGVLGYHIGENNTSDTLFAGLCQICFEKLKNEVKEERILDLIEKVLVRCAENDCVQHVTDTFKNQLDKIDSSILGDIFGKLQLDIADKVLVKQFAISAVRATIQESKSKAIGQVIALDGTYQDDKGKVVQLFNFAGLVFRGDNRNLSELIRVNGFQSQNDLSDPDRLLESSGLKTNEGLGASGKSGVSSSKFFYGALPYSCGEKESGQVYLLDTTFLGDGKAANDIPALLKFNYGQEKDSSGGEVNLTSLPYNAIIGSILVNEEDFKNPKKLLKELNERIYLNPSYEFQSSKLFSMSINPHPNKIDYLDNTSFATKNYKFNPDASKRHNLDGSVSYYYKTREFLTQTITKDVEGEKMSIVDLGSGVTAIARTQIKDGAAKRSVKKIYNSKPEHVAHWRNQLSQKQQEVAISNQLLDILPTLDVVNPDISKRMIVELHLTPYKSVMPLAPGKELSKLGKNEIESPAFKAAFKQALQDMQTMHDNKFTLRDITADNMLFDGTSIFFFDLAGLEYGDIHLDVMVENIMILLITGSSLGLLNTVITQNTAISSEKVKEFLKSSSANYADLAEIFKK